jgi:C4-dicarboxylate-specific signal transduction histidine kinase
MFRIALLFCLMLPCLALAVGEDDSLALEKVLRSLPPKERLEFLQGEVRRTMRNDPRLAIDIAHRSLNLAIDLNDKAARVQALMDIGVAHYYLGDYHNALRRYEEALALAEDLGDKVRVGNAVNNIGILFFVWGEHDRALEYYLRALALRLETEDTEGAASCYNNIAAVHHTAGRHNSAQEYYQQALEIYRENGNQIYEASTLNNIGLVLYEKGQFDEAVVVLHSALDLELGGKDRSVQALSLNNLGMVRAKQGRLDEALGLFREALAIRREIAHRQGESVSLQLLGTALVENGNLDGGIALLEEALAIARELEVQELIRDDLEALAEAWEKAGRHDRALEYYRLFKEAHDRIFDEDRARQMAAAEASFEVDLKDQEIAGLRREADFEAFRQRIMLLGAGLSAVIMVLLWNRYRFQKRAHQEIRVQNEALSQAHSELEKAAREELAHVARVATMGELTAAFAHELHQPLTAIKTNARAARILLSQPVDDRDEVDEALVDIKDDAERAREIISRLREMMRKGEERRKIHDLNGVVRSAVKFVEGAAQNQGVEIRLELEADLSSVSCDRIQLQQVVMNLVQNGLAAMEFQGDEIVIRTAAIDDGQVMVQVRDGGPEVSQDVLSEMFDPFFTTKTGGLGMGLPICRSIIEAHGGSLSSTLNEDGGLTMEFRLPGYGA